MSPTGQAGWLCARTLHRLVPEGKAGGPPRPSPSLSLQRPSPWSQGCGRCWILHLRPLPGLSTRAPPDQLPLATDADDPRLVDVQHRERHVRVPGVQSRAPAAQLQRVLVGPRRCPCSRDPKHRGGAHGVPGPRAQPAPGGHLWHPPSTRFHPQWIMDVLVCNGLGIYCGMKTLEWLSLKTYKWQGLWNIPTYKCARRPILAFGGRWGGHRRGPPLLPACPGPPSSPWPIPSLGHKEKGLLSLLFAFMEAPGTPRSRGARSPASLLMVPSWSQGQDEADRLPVHAL